MLPLGSVSVHWCYHSEQEGRLPPPSVVCAYGRNSSLAYPPFLESLEGFLESSPPGGSFVLIGDLLILPATVRVGGE